ncbi:MAG: DNA-processing protein DprA [Oscillospiraceae bacterium]|nr:DNA-processing protein DprA [Oscillospiraceae bacterium]MBR4092481.1 DNA-processing protein DprA [Oscillospiraceae bacterium]
MYNENDAIFYWLWLVDVFGPGNNRIWEVLSHFDNDPIAAYKALQEKDCKYITKSEYKNVCNTFFESMYDLMDYCNLNNYNVISIDDERYPQRLKEIFNPPAVLFCMGDPSFINNEVVLTVVGTRKPSDYSMEFARKICAELVKSGVVLASGFALGIDSAAHRAALKANSKTVAVLGCGLNVNYPSQNAEIKKVIAVHGAVITEFFPGTRPEGKNFPQRNRILSGISLGTLVVEASQRSGALITADFAMNQGRDVFCVPPADLFDQRYAGVIRLIREGAIPTFSHLDVLFEYYENFSHKLVSVNPFSDYSSSEEFFKEKPYHIIESNTKQNSNLKVSTEKEDNISEEKVFDFSEYSDIQKAIITVLQNGGSLTPDEISALTGRDISSVLSELTELEINGDIIKNPGQRYSV